MNDKQDKVISDAIEKALLEFTSKGLDESNGRKMIIYSGKGGALMGIEAFERACGKSEEDVQRIVKEAKKTLKEGMYRFDSTSLNLFEYLGKV